MFAMAQSENAIQFSELETIESQRFVLAQEKKAVLDRFQEASKACWRQFAVNDCLFKARQQKYQGLTPLDQREMTLNERQRLLKEAARLERLNGKSIESLKDKAQP